MSKPAIRGNLGHILDWLTGIRHALIGRDNASSTTTGWEQPPVYQRHDRSIILGGMLDLSSDR